MQKPAATDTAPTRSNLPQTQPSTRADSTLLASRSPFINNPTQSSAPAWSPNVQEPTTPPPTPVAENQDEDVRKRVTPPWSPLYGAALGGEAMLGSGQAYTPGAPLVQGTPQMGSVPGVTGSPSPYTNPPVTHPMQGPGNAPGTHAIQGPGNASVTHPVQGPTHPPITHPVQGPTHMPFPQPRPQPIQQPPEQPGGTHPPTHKHHRHHDHPDEHEHPQHSTHPGHELHRVARVSKVAGGSTVKTILIVVVAAAVVAAGGIVAATHFLSRPQPLISITSKYKVGNTLAGATGTILHINGQKFSSNSAITFLLDGHAAPGNPGTRSDANGNFRTDMTITNAWSVGAHTLTARDASNNSTQKSVSVTIVQPGQANTPGLNGAPPDDASFKVLAQINGKTAEGSPYSGQETEIVTGHPDPMGGTVCQTEDSGQPIVTTGFTFNGHVPYRETSTYSCVGSYKGGKLTFTETLQSDSFVFSQSDGTQVTCTLNSAPQTSEQLSATYTGNNTFSGAVTYPTIPDSNYPCNGGNYYRFHEGAQGSWIGQVTNLHS